MLLPIFLCVTVSAHKNDWELLVPIVHNGYQALSRSPCQAERHIDMGKLGGFVQTIASRVPTRYGLHTICCRAFCRALRSTQRLRQSWAAQLRAMSSGAPPLLRLEVGATL